MKYLICLIVLFAACSKKPNRPFSEPLPRKPVQENQPPKDNLDVYSCNDIWVLADGDISLDEKFFADGNINRPNLEGQSLEKVLKQFDECESFFIKKYEYEKSEETS